MTGHIEKDRTPIAYDHDISLRAACWRKRPIGVEAVRVQCLGHVRVLLYGRKAVIRNDNNVGLSGRGPFGQARPARRPALSSDA